MNVSCTAASSLELKLCNTLYMSTNVTILVFLYGCASNSNIIQNQKVFKPIATGYIYIYIYIYKFWNRYRASSMLYIKNANKATFNILGF